MFMGSFLKNAKDKEKSLWEYDAVEAFLLGDAVRVDTDSRMFFCGGRISVNFAPYVT